jgi:hypothetical protein
MCKEAYHEIMPRNEATDLIILSLFVKMFEFEETILSSITEIINFQFKSQGFI